MFPLAEALGEISLPLSLGIVGTDTSHTEAGSEGTDLIACRSVVNDSPILGRLFALQPSNLYVVPGSVLTVTSILICVVAISSGDHVTIFRPEIAALGSFEPAVM